MNSSRPDWHVSVGHVNHFGHRLRRWAGMFSPCTVLLLSRVLKLFHSFIFNRCIITTLKPITAQCRHVVPLSAWPFDLTIDTPLSPAQATVYTKSGSSTPFFSARCTSKTRGQDNLYNNWDLSAELTSKRHYVRRWNFACWPTSYVIVL